MGKIRTKTIGIEEVEEKEKKAATARRESKKVLKQAQEKPDEEKDTDVLEAVKEETLSAEAEKPAKPAKKAGVKKIKVRGKKYITAIAKTDRKKSYTIDDAVGLLKKITYAGFDETVEIHLNLLNENVKGEVTLPHGTGKKVKVAIADDAVLADIDGGKVTFDVLIAHPSFMPKLVKYARVLGPKGLMPNPKNGTVSEKPEEAAKKFADGALRYKSEAKFPLLHQSMGKLSFEEKQLVENVKAFVSAVSSRNIQDAFLKTTMSPSVRISLE